jgi:hypothetical protein
LLKHADGAIAPLTKQSPHGTPADLMIMVDLQRLSV